MRRYDWFTLGALLILVLACPLYGLRESGRMARAQEARQGQYLASATRLYLEQCANCHGLAGQGVGVAPPLNALALAHANPEALYYTIAHSPHGSAMAAWHTSEGGPLSHYQVESLVTLIRYADWESVAQLGEQIGFGESGVAAAPVTLTALETGAVMDPHECRACHEEPAVHAERFGLNCARCHTLEAWKPALLVRHTFDLDHGGNGRLACQTCHVATYAEHTCYTCHEHQPEEMETVHALQSIADLNPCANCHPTGATGEAAAMLLLPDAAQSNALQK